MELQEVRLNLIKAVEAAWLGGVSILDSKKRGYNVNYKADASPVTDADMASHLAIEHILGTSDFPRLSEEGELLDYDERINWSNYWSIDPLDGTKEFTRGSDEYTVNIALIVDQQPVAGVIVLPEREESYWGGPGIGLFQSKGVPRFADCLSDEYLGKPAVLPETFTAVVNRAHLNSKTQFYLEQLEEKHGEIVVRRAGSSTKFIDLSLNKAHLYPRFSPCMEWDTAAGHALLRANGLEILSLETNQPLKYNRESLYNPPFLAGRY
ncbi:MAG: 3'(2'),5'-bisphosphate nucleotidase CysQ family protein [Flavobacteriales bacterium]